MTCFPAQPAGRHRFLHAVVRRRPMSLPDGGRRLRAGRRQARVLQPATDDHATATAAPAAAAISAACAPTSPRADEGVCVTMQPCTTDSRLPESGALDLRGDVPQPALRERTRTSHSDHLYCLQRDCVAGGSACGAGRNPACPSWSPAAAHPPDICVPNCDSQDRCPPNHFCFRKLSGAGSPHICLPGLLGFLCESDIDCIVGKCLSDDGAGRGAAPQPVHGPLRQRRRLREVGQRSGQVRLSAERGRCATPDAYRGARCYDDADCTRDEGTSCVFSSKPNGRPTRGPAAASAPADGTCTPRGGFGHVCLPFTVVARRHVEARLLPRLLRPPLHRR